MSNLINNTDLSRMYLESDDDYEPYGFYDINETQKNNLLSLPANKGNHHKLENSKSSY